MSESKNPYPSDTPEWQLFENMVSSARCSTAFATDADCYLEKSSKAREKSEAYRAALEKLTGKPMPSPPMIRSVSEKNNES